MADSQRLILVVEDDPSIQRFLQAYLPNQGFRLLIAKNAQEGIALAGSHRPCLVLLDLGLPDTDGLEVIRRLREWSQMPIIVISARGKETDKVEALNNGADDYLTKPFGVEELLARIRVCLRHDERAAPSVGEPVFETGKLRIDLEKRQVFFDDQEVHLTPIEYKVVALLVKHAGKVVTQRQLLLEIWGQARQEETHYLRIYMHQLRQKLEPNPVRPRYLITEPGVGYRLKDE